MDDSINSDLTKEMVMNDVDNVILDKFNRETLESAVKPANIELIEDNKKLIDSSNNSDKPDKEIDPIRETLSGLLDMYTQKTGHQITYDSVEDSIRVMTMSSKSTKELIKSIQGDLAANMSDVLIFKSIIVIGKVIDSQLNGILSTDFTNSLSGETVSILSQMFGWIEKLEAIKSKYGQFDIDLKIRELTSSKSDVTARTEAEKKLIDIIRAEVDRGVKT